LLFAPKKIDARPHSVPVTIEWPEEFYMRDQDGVHIDVAGENKPFYEVGLDIRFHDENGPLTFRVSTDNKYVDYEIRFVNGTVEYIPLGNEGVYVSLPRKAASLGEWFLNEPPLIRFADGSFLVKDKLYHPYAERRLRFDPARISVWDWTGVSIKKESQYSRGAKRLDSIQYRVIQELISPANAVAYDIVMDDDNPGEAADVVAIAATDERLTVHLFHCKFSKEENPGARVDDLYAVCGQAQRSVHWRALAGRLLGHLLRRESKRLSAGGVSRFEKGDFQALQTLARKAPLLKPDFKIFIVQPGLSARAAGPDELELLGATEIHLKETYQIPLEVIASG
jgi:hypothetical protein